MARKEAAHQWRMAVLWIALTIMVVAALIVWGIPAFIKLAVWYGDFKSGENAIMSDDTVPPAPPRISLPYTATNSANLELNGFSEPGSTVKIFVNDEEVRTVAAEDNGQFDGGRIKLKKGFNMIYGVALDAAGNKSGQSRKEQVLYDNQPPQLIVESPQTGAQFFGSGERRVEVKGQTEIDTEVTVNDRSVIVGQEGDFSGFVELQDGEQKLLILAVDEAGNETVEEIKVTYHP